MAVMQYNPFGELKSYGPEDRQRIKIGRELLDQANNATAIGIGKQPARELDTKESVQRSEAQSILHDHDYNTNKDSNGSLIAVSYEARAKGVKRNMRGHEAIKLCPNIILITVPTKHSKADLKLYRDAGSKVVQVLSQNGPTER